jgi:proteasome lid subunit RPN8/RPN11
MPNLLILTVPETVDAIKRHAVTCFPNEACGVVTAKGFVPLPNRHPEPAKFFDCGDDAAEFQIAGTLLAVVHSHPCGPRERVLPNYPSAADMTQQMAMDVPWGLCVSSADRATDPFWWGPGIAIPPLAGRKFRHGPSGTDNRGDCYALIRDYYFVAHGIDLPDFPRTWNWWLDPACNLYEEGFATAGFTPVPKTDVRVGDIGLIAIPIKAQDGSALPLRVVHGAIYVGDGQVLHHKHGRLSMQEHLQSWTQLTKYWVRHNALA